MAFPPLSSYASSFENPASEKHKVYLSFRGVDTGKNFASHLCAALRSGNITTFCIDHDNIPEKNEIIYHQSSKAIEESKLSIIIFSENYASSTWCLEELTHILKCKREMRQVVVAIFYNLEPSAVRKQQGSYATAFDSHEKSFKHRMEKLQQWRAALTQAADLTGWVTRLHRSESQLVEEIVRHIQKILNRTLLSGLVGIEKHIGKIIELLRIGSHDIRVVGIWGAGGIGKTTLAKAVYKHLSSQFEVSYFLADVREESKKSGLVSLQRKLVTELFEEEYGSPTILKRMRKFKRVLLVLDDVDDSEQFKLLIEEPYKWFSAGSRIIVTARDSRVLKNIAVDEVYGVDVLNRDEAMELFHLNAASKGTYLTTDYFELSERIVEYSKGLPLAIKIMGFYLKTKSKYEWESAINKLEIDPNMEIQNVFRVCYDGLNDIEKDAFLDIACFFKGEHTEFVEQLLGYGSSIYTAIDHLIDRSRLTIKHNKQLWMHDLVQQMGWEIVRQESTAEPGKRSRLWNSNDVYHVLKTNTGTAAIEGISLETPEINREIKLSPTVFNKMQNLRLLKINSYDENTKKWKVHLPQGLQYLPSSLKYLHWDGYPLKCLPSNFNPRNLVGLILPNSHIEQLWPGVKNLRHLKLLDLSHSKYLTEIRADFYGQAPNLECIDLQFCTRLVQVPSSFQYLDKLSILSLRGCSSLEEFPMLPRNIRNLDLSGTLIRQMPSSIDRLSHLETLNLDMCKNLGFLPASISSLRSLKEISIFNRTSLETVSHSRLALTQGRDDYNSLQHSNGRFGFLNCLKLDEEYARTDIMGEAQLTFLKKAVPSSKDEEGRIFEIWYPGDKIPEWFSYQSKGSSIQVQLPPNWCVTNFLGFALGFNICFEDCHIDGNFDLYLQVGLAMDYGPDEFVEDILTFNWKNDLDGHDHPIVVDSEYVFLFNYRNNSFTRTYDNTTAASFKFYSNKRGCDVKRCGVRPLYTEDVEKIIFDVSQRVGKLSEIEDVTTHFKDVDLFHEPEASGSLNVHDARMKKEEDRETIFHDSTQAVAESSKIEIEEEEEEEDNNSDFEDGTFSDEHESSGSLDVHEADTKKEEDGDLNPNENYRKIKLATYCCSCFMFLPPLVDIFRHVLGRQSGSDRELHSEEPLQAPDKVLHSIMTELGEHNQRISQHLQTVMPKTSHESFDSLETSPTSRVAPSHSTATENELPESPEEILDSLCLQIIEVRDQNSEILQRLEALVRTAPDVQFGELFPELTSSPSASRINDLFEDVIAADQHVQVSEEVIHSLRSHLTDLRDHNQQILQFLRTAILSNSPTPTNRFSGELIEAAGSSASSSIPINLKKYDVFISFRGEDTRNNFTSHLYGALSKKNIKTYIDDCGLERGEAVSPALLKAIQESKISIIIFSKNYAFSRWCLEELNHILQCKDQHGLLVVPVFYHITPSDVKKQQGSYEGVFAVHEKRFEQKKVKQWKGALERAASLPGWDSSVTRPESKLVEAIANDVLEKLSVISAGGYEDKGLEGTERRVKRIDSLLQMGSSDDAIRIVGIWGVTGIGKTTLARIIFNRFASQFESCCFLENVNVQTEQHGYSHVRKKLFSELLKENDPNITSRVPKDRVRHSKTLIVLDHVDASMQFEYLIGDLRWFGPFGPGSRILITTRDVQVLSKIKVDGVYKVEELNVNEAFQLFCSQAFGGLSVPSDYMKLLIRMINHAKGIPLVLEDLAHRLHSKSKEEWESELNRLEKGFFPI